MILAGFSKLVNNEAWETISNFNLNRNLLSHLIDKKLQASLWKYYKRAISKEKTLKSFDLSQQKKIPRTQKQVNNTKAKYYETIHHWLNNEPRLRMQTAAQKLLIKEKILKSSDVFLPFVKQMSPQTIQQEKFIVLSELYSYNEDFKALFRRYPGKRENLPISKLYEYYNALRFKEQVNIKLHEAICQLEEQISSIEDEIFKYNMKEQGMPANQHLNHETKQKLKNEPKIQIQEQIKIQLKSQKQLSKPDALMKAYVKEINGRKEQISVYQQLMNLK